MSSRSFVVAHPGAELYGSDRVLLDSVIGLRETGADVTVVLPAQGALVDSLEQAGARVRVEPTFVIRKSLLRPSGWAEGLSSAWRGWRAAHRVLAEERPDAVFVNTVTLPLWPMIARLRRIPTVLHIHEAESAASRVVKSLLYFPALFVDRILINSDFSRRVMAATYPRLTKRTTLVPNAVPGPASVSPLRPTLDGGMRIAYVGRLSPRKGPDVVVDALSLLDARGMHASLEIVGSVFDGYEWYEQELRSQIESAGLGDRVRLHGFHPDIWAFLADADLMVVPSRLDEPFGNTAVEGVLAGRPVVVSATSGLMEATAGVDTAIRVAPDSARALADGIQTAHDRWAVLRERVDDARATVTARHSPAAYRARIGEIVTNLVG